MTVINRSEETWLKILKKCGVAPATASRWALAFSREVTAEAFSKGEKELDVFLGQILHESGKLEHMQENLRYSAARIRELGAKSPKGSRWAAAAEKADYLANNPERIANFLYANRFGNGDEASGDGWKFRGRCPIGLTFKDNYAFIGDIIGQDLTVMPELIEQPHYALEATIAFWEGKIPDSILNNVTLITKRIQGQDFGLKDRVHLTEVARVALDTFTA